MTGSTFAWRSPTFNRIQLHRWSRSGESGRAKQPLTRSEWVFLSQYIQVATEDLATERRAAAGTVLHQPVRSISRRPEPTHGPRSGLDRYYLGNFGVPEGAGFNERQLDPELVPQTVAELIEGLRQNPGRAVSPPSRDACFYVALRDEVDSDLAALNRAARTASADSVPPGGARALDARASPGAIATRSDPSSSDLCPRLRSKAAFSLSGNVNGKGEVSLLHLDGAEKRACTRSARFRRSESSRRCWST